MTQTYSQLEPPAPPKFNPPGFIRQGHPLVRIAGLSGAAAVALGAYGAHGKIAHKFLFVTCNAGMQHLPIVKNLVIVIQAFHKNSRLPRRGATQKVLKTKLVYVRSIQLKLEITNQ